MPCLIILTRNKFFKEQEHQNLPEATSLLASGSFIRHLNKLDFVRIGIGKAKMRFYEFARILCEVRQEEH